jgi:hypothetical protein
MAHGTREQRGGKNGFAFEFHGVFLASQFEFSKPPQATCHLCTQRALETLRALGFVTTRTLCDYHDLRY